MDYTSSIEGFATNALGGAAAGSAVPGIGTLIGGGLGLVSGLGSLIGGIGGGDKVGDGKGKFNGLHGSKYEPLDDSRLTKEDADKYISFASRPGISVEEAAIMMGREVKRNPGATPGAIWDGFSAGTSFIGNTASEVRQIIAREYDYWGEYPALVMYDRTPQVITLRAAAASVIQTMSAPAPTNSPALGQYSQLPNQGAQALATGFTLPSTATAPYVALPATAASNTPAATPKDNTTTYAIIGGGALLVLLVAILLLKKK
jgi:hypothetical protein